MECIPYIQGIVCDENEKSNKKRKFHQISVLRINQAVNAHVKQCEN